MMKFKLKDQKGVTMIALVITIIILIILTNILIYNAKDSIDIEKLNNLYSDISYLRDKVEIYYNENNGEIPKKTEYIISNDSELNNILGTNDIGKFYIIDLEVMQGITLNYGKDYEKIKNGTFNIENDKDIYIINENSHNIFYVGGITVSVNNIDKIYYTDYIEPDNTNIDLRYINGILIPEGYKFLHKENEGTSNETILIENEEGIQYIWQKHISLMEISTIPGSIKLSEEQSKEEFVESVNTYKGYFKNKNKTIEIDVVYLPINEQNWSESYTKDTIYTDSNNQTAIIPQGFKVSMSPAMNTIEKGLVIKDNNEIEWVWIEVPKDIYIDQEYTISNDDGRAVISSDDYEGIYNILNEYVKEYRDNSNYKDEYYIGCGVQATETKTASQVYTEMYNKMLSSIYSNGGFWISRYEVGTGKNCSEAQEQVDELLEDSEKTTSLPFGIQWDLICKFLNNESILKTNATISYELTLEHAINGDNKPCTKRGNIQYDENSEKMESSRNNVSTTNSLSIDGFRSVLY